MNPILSITIIVLFVLQIVAAVTLFYVVFRMGKNVFTTVKAYLSRVTAHGWRIGTVGKQAYAANRGVILETVQNVQGFADMFKSKETPAPDLAITYDSIWKTVTFLGTANRLKNRVFGRMPRKGTPPGPAPKAQNPLLRVADKAGLLPPILMRFGGVWTVIRFAIDLQKAWKQRFVR